MQTHFVIATLPVSRPHMKRAATVVQYLQHKDTNESQKQETDAGREVHADLRKYVEQEFAAK